MSSRSDCSSSGSPPPSPRALESWDSDVLLTTHLHRISEPSAAKTVPHDILRDRARCLKRRIEELERVKGDGGPHERENVDMELAGTLFKWKLVVWAGFPINSLPDETLVNIFRHVVMDSSSPKESIRRRLCLTWTCRLWRAVAIDDKALWSTVWFWDKPPFTRSLAWVERAGGAPLHLRISDHSLTAPLTAQKMEGLLDRLLPKIAQIRTLLIEVQKLAPAAIALHKLWRAGALMSMERFELHRWGGAATTGAKPDVWLEPMALFNGGVPRLRRLCIDGVNIDWDNSLMTNLVALDLHRMGMAVRPDIRQWRAILEGCPNLVKLSLDAFGPPWHRDTPLTLPPIPLPTLRSLRIRNCDLRYAMFHFTQFSAPNVVSLALEHLKTNDYAPLVERLTGSMPYIKILTLRGFSMHAKGGNAKKMARWLDSMPRLRFVRFDVVSSCFLRIFLEDPRKFRANIQDEKDTSTARREVLCPDLRFVHSKTQDPTSLIALIEGRKRLRVPFRKVYMPYWSPAIIPPRLHAAAGPDQLYCPEGEDLTDEEKEIYFEIGGREAVTIHDDTNSDWL